MYSKGPLHEPFFIALILKGDIIIRPTKKLLASYIYLANLNTSI